MTALPRALTVPQIARRYGLAEETVRRHIREGRLRAFRFTDERHRVSSDAVAEWIRSLEQGQSR